MADLTTDAPAETGAVRRSRRRRRRRRVVVAVTVGVVAVAGAGSAWAMSGTDSPTYRLVAATRANVGQTVAADGTLSAADTAALSFAAAGTVSSVKVAVGDKVAAGQTIATLDPTTLDAAVTSAEADLAQAKQTLANDQEAQLNGTTVSASTNSGSNTGAGSGGAANSAATTSDTSTANAVAVNSAVTIRLTAAAKPTAPTTTGSVSAARAAQQAVIKAQRGLDTAITAQDSAVDALAISCAASDETTPTTTTVTAGDDGTVTGSAGSGKAVVTLRTTDGDLAETSSTNPQRLAAGDRWSFTGLDAGSTYRVELVRSEVVDSTECTSAVSTVVDDQRDVDSASKSLATAITALDKAIAALPTTSSTGSGAGATTGSGSKTGGATTGGTATTGSATTGAAKSGGATANSSTAGSAGAGTASTSSGVLVTAARLAADTESVDAKQAALAVATQNRRHATLTSSLAGTVASVALAKGDSVSASSSSATVTVVGAGTLSSVVDIGIADIDLVEVGQTVAVSVDGRTATLPGHVTFIGTSNSADSTSSSATYPVTVALDRRDAALYDGMGVGLAIDVGTASNVLTVPLSAVHTTGNRSTVDVYSGGTVTPTTVTLGLVGDDRVQIKSGLKAGQQVVLAEVSAAVPTSDTSNRRGGNALTGTGGGAGGAGGGPPAGGGPGGR